MRVVLLLLVAANLLAFAWGQGWLVPIIGDVRQPERMDRQVGPDRLRVLGPSDRARTERAVAGRVESDEEAGPASGPAAGIAQARPERAEPVARADATDGGAGADDVGLREMASRLTDKPAPAASTLAARAAAPGAPVVPVSPTTEASPDVPGAPASAVSPADTLAARKAATTDTGVAAPAVPFGLAEPPITAALANDTAQRATANAVASPDDAPGASPGPDARPPRPVSGPAVATAAMPGNLETGSWPAPLASAGVATPACFDLRGLDAVRAEAARDQLEGMGAASIEELGVENRSGYIVYLPAFDTAELAQARIEQLREQGVRDIYLVLDGTYRFAVSLGVFNRMDSVELLLGELRARGVEDARVGYVNPAATRMTLRVRGPEDLLDEAQMRAMASLRGGQLARCP